MNKVSIVWLIVLASNIFLSIPLSARSSIAKEPITLYDHLCVLNSEWLKYHNHNIQGLHEPYEYVGWESLIERHLQLVENHLSGKTIEGLSATQIKNRSDGLDILEDYWKDGSFPKNTNHNFTIPYFIDDFNTACAVGHIMRESGGGDIAAYIQQNFNYDFIADMPEDAVNNWASEMGFTVDELKWIQPAYQPPFLLTEEHLQPDCNTQNGAVYLGMEANPDWWGGDSSTLESINYRWQNGFPFVGDDIVSEDRDLTNAPAGFYSVVASGDFWPEAVLTLALNDQSDLEIRASISDQKCPDTSDGRIDLSVEGGTPPYSYAWYDVNNELIGSEASITGLEGTYPYGIDYGYQFGNYRVEVRDDAGCAWFDQFTVYVENDGVYISTWDVSITPVSCSDLGSIQLGSVFGAEPITYVWDDGHNGADRTDLQAGDYTLTVIDANGCFETKVFTVEDNCNSVSCEFYPFFELEYQYGHGTDDEPQSYAAMVFCLRGTVSDAEAQIEEWNWVISNAQNQTTILLVGQDPCDVELPIVQSGVNIEEPYRICLTAIDETGCEQSFCQNFYLGGGEGCIDGEQITLEPCPEYYSPVCGCNGVTYSNECLAQNSGVTLWTAGTCEADTLFCSTQDRAWINIKIYETNMNAGSCLEGVDIYEFEGRKLVFFNFDNTTGTADEYYYCSGELVCSVSGFNSDCELVDEYLFLTNYWSASNCINTNIPGAGILESGYSNCLVYIAPIEGCDGNFYGNECVAFFNSGVSPKSWGTCPERPILAVDDYPDYQLEELFFINVLENDQLVPNPGFENLYQRWRLLAGGLTPIGDFEVEAEVALEFHTDGSYGIVADDILIDSGSFELLQVDGILFIQMKVGDQETAPLSTFDYYIIIQEHNLYFYQEFPEEIPPLAHFQSSDIIDGAQITVSISQHPEFGELTLNENKTFSYSAGNEFVNYDSFIYTICEINGICSSATVFLSYSDVPPIKCPDPDLINEDFDCTFEYSPVCGCDGRSYPNVCVATNHYGIIEYSIGACPDTVFCGNDYTWLEQKYQDLNLNKVDCECALIEYDYLGEPIFVGSYYEGGEECAGLNYSYYNCQGDLLCEWQEGASVEDFMNQWCFTDFHQYKQLSKVHWNSCSTHEEQVILLDDNYELASIDGSVALDVLDNDNLQPNPGGKWQLHKVTGGWSDGHEINSLVLVEFISDRELKVFDSSVPLEYTTSYELDEEGGSITVWIKNVFAGEQTGVSDSLQWQFGYSSDRNRMNWSQEAFDGFNYHFRNYLDVDIDIERNWPEGLAYVNEKLEIVFVPHQGFEGSAVLEYSVRYGLNNDQFTSAQIVINADDFQLSCEDSNLITDTEPCPLAFAPVCGCNGITYDNNCIALNQGILQWEDGICNDAGVCNWEEIEWLKDIVNAENGDCCSNKELYQYNFQGQTVFEILPSYNYNVCPIDLPAIFYNCEGEILCISDGAIAEGYCSPEFISELSNPQLVWSCSFACIDSTLINEDFICTTDFSPVCGCDGATYANSCEALYHHGLTEWTDGPCSQDCQENYYITATPGQTSEICPKFCGVDESTVTIESVSATFSGTAIVSNSNRLCIEYTPLAGYEGEDIINVTACDTSGNCNAITVIVSVTDNCLEDCVWPGDANNDGVVNTLDVFALGFAYGSTGPGREQISNLWEPQSAQQWNEQINVSAAFEEEDNSNDSPANVFTFVIDKKFTDCNGDGKIDIDDLDAIDLNFGQSHGKSSGSKSFSDEAVLKMLPRTNSIQKGDSLYIDFILEGKNGEAIEDIYGIAFDICYRDTTPGDVTMVIDSTATFHFSNSWLTSETEVLSFTKNRIEHSTLSNVGSRTQGTAASGAGNIGFSSIVIEDDVAKRNSNDEVQFELKNVFLQKINGMLIPLEGQSLTIEVATFLSDNDLKEATTIYPNPANETLHIHWTPVWHPSKITLFNLLGEELTQIRTKANDQYLQLDVQALLPGIYFLQLTDGSNQFTTKVNIK